MNKYIFSGGMTNQMVEYLQKIKAFEPMDVLVSQLDRSSIKKMIEYADKGVVKSLFIDSGAYSQYTGKIGVIDVDEYISYVDEIDKYIYAVAQVDTLPGKFGTPKHKEDYVVSADKSWENFLYMYGKMKSPKKLIPVFHFGESFDALKRMLDWRDPEGEPIRTIGLSPANDSAQSVKDVYLQQCYDFIAKSSHPDVRTHLFGMTSLQGLRKFPCYSADSVSHRLRTGYNKLFTRKWGTVSLSDRSRTTKTKSNMSFLETCDNQTYKEFEELAASYGFTVEQLKNENTARVAMDIVETQLAVKNEYKYDPNALKRSKKLW